MYRTCHEEINFDRNPTLPAPPQKLRLLRCHDEPRPIRWQLLPHPPTTIGLLFQGRRMGLPRLAVPNLRLRLLCQPVHQVTHTHKCTRTHTHAHTHINRSLLFFVPQHPLPHSTERAPLARRGQAPSPPNSGHAHSLLIGLSGSLAVCGRVVRPLPDQWGDDEVRENKLLKLYRFGFHSFNFSYILFFLLRFFCCFFRLINFI